MWVIEPIELSDGIKLRLLARDDAAPLALAYAKNRGHLSPWDPVRSEGFFTTAWQEGITAQQLAGHAAGASVPLVLATRTHIVGRITLSGITRGAFESASLGYWLDEDLTGRGLMSSGIGHVVDIARHNLGLHRLQAETLLHNQASQRVLQKLGFEEIGMAPNYLRIAGEWQDHRLFQRILRD